jgi:hypothetical protein
MKNIFILVLMMPVVLFSQENNFSIKGILKGMPDKTELVLKANDGSTEPLLLIKSKGDQFEGTGKINEPGLFQLEVKNGAQKMMLFLDASNVKLKEISVPCQWQWLPDQRHMMISCSSMPRLILCSQN